ncbi:hypothetical protein [uncultured Shewanella sp.]|uniref:hypothetical protein n=1 Tax=uncultured Shewanella sp. TaxID=173975 RepID=UPI0026122290|nr:hypothetical protein [uncultured Shewanella sp.]
MFFHYIKFYLLLGFLVLLTACASGSSIVTGTVRAPVNLDSVKLYLDEPVNYQTIAIVKASSDAGFTEQGSQDYAVAELKKQAAKLGANGVLITATGEQSTAFYNMSPNTTNYTLPITAQTLTGKAIYVSE